MRNALIVGTAVLAGLTTGGCATITRGSSQEYTIKSEPAGADVKLSTGLECKTPCTLNLKRKGEFVANLTKDGYDPVAVEVESKFSGGGGAALAGNALVGGFIGAGVDAASGALNSLFPENLTVKLAPVGSGEQASLLDAKGVVIKTVAEHNDKAKTVVTGPATASSAPVTGN